MNRAVIFHWPGHLEIRLLQRKFSRLSRWFLDNISTTEHLCLTPLLDIHRRVKYIPISRLDSLGYDCRLVRWQVGGIQASSQGFLHFAHSLVPSFGKIEATTRQPHFVSFPQLHSQHL